LKDNYDKNRESYTVNFISENQVEVFDRGRKETLKYDLDRNTLTVNLKDDKKKIIEFVKVIGDSLLAKDSITFFNPDDYLFEDNSIFQREEYDLIDIDKEYLSHLDSRGYLFFHLYQSNQGEKMFRVGYSIMNIDSVHHGVDLLRYHNQVDFGNGFFYPIVIFIGEGVSLEDLKKAYLELTLINSYWSPEVKLVLRKEDFSDYYFFRDETDINWFDAYGKEGYINEIVRPFPPPPPPSDGGYSLKDYLKMKPETIKINSKTDFSKIENLNPQKRYFISINHELSFEDYIDLKKVIKDLKRSTRIEIRTDIK